MLPPYSTEAAILKPGIYQHYSGKQYEVLGVGRHSESLEELVIYRALYAPYDFWVRPLSMFIESVEINGQTTPRFQLI
ncbi:MAG: DUF1653 domain-containing protein [Rhabdochlamydiaceae bacterium]|nr:DUF1653 domain-containing protein [Rhabdochlamydiaceae bacterium]